MAFDPFLGATKLLLHGDGTNGSTTFTDSAQGATMTLVGTASISTARSKFGGASILFNGSTGCLTTPDSANWTLGANDFTIECWANFTTVPGAGVSQVLISQYTSVWSNLSFTLYYDGSNGWCFSTSTTGAAALTITSASTATANVWQHIAVVRYGTGITLYVDGASVGTYNISTSTIYDSSAVLCVGAGSAGTALFYNGYLDDVRFTKGYARYTTTFSVPTTAHEDSVGTIMLLNCNGTATGTTIVDVEGYTLTCNGNAQLSATSKFGSASIVFDGTGDDVTVVQSSTQFSLGTADFTIECWAQFAGAGSRGLFSFGAQSVGEPYGINLYLSGTDIYGLYAWNANGYGWNAGTVGSTWHHFALQRISGVMYCLMDGVTLAVSSTVGAGIAPGVSFTTTSLHIGASFTNSTTNSMNGYIDDFRITKGYARYPV